MIKPVTYFTAICDGCGKDAGDDSMFSAWGTHSDAENDAIESGDWIEHDGSHYCTNCYHYDDDGEPIVNTTEIKNETSTKQ